MERRTGAGILGGSLAVAVVVVGMANVQSAPVAPPGSPPPEATVPTVPETPEQSLERLFAAIDGMDFVDDPASRRACDDLLAQAQQEGRLGVVNCHIRRIPAPPVPPPPQAGSQPGS